MQYHSSPVRIYKEEPHGGFLPPKMRHEHVTRFVARATNTNLQRTFPETDDILEQKHFSFPLEVVYMVQSLRQHIFSHQSFFVSVVSMLFLLPLLFLHHGHFLYMFNWIILYVSCTKRNDVTHLSTTCTHKDLKIVYRAAWTSSFPHDEGKTHTPTHTHTD